jgi:hypothetical protein
MRMPSAITVPSKIEGRTVLSIGSNQSLEIRFRTLVNKWKDEVLHSSSVKKMINHSYLGIIGMGPSVLPLLLSELNERPDHWLIALNAITQEDPAPDGATFDEAVSAWLAWGRERNFLT